MPLTKERTQELAQILAEKVQAEREAKGAASTFNVWWGRVNELLAIVLEEQNVDLNSLSEEEKVTILGETAYILVRTRNNQ